MDSTIKLYHGASVQMLNVFASSCLYKRRFRLSPQVDAVVHDDVHDGDCDDHHVVVVVGGGVDDDDDVVVVVDDDDDDDEG